jgi:molybdate transport system ATP-binding protein
MTAPVTPPVTPPTIAVALHGTRGDFALDVACTVQMHGVTALLGRSGSGKTSVLRALTGLDRHVGVVRFGDTVWQDATTFVPAHRRRVGWVAQGAALLPHLTVAANLDYAARRAVPGPFDRADIVARTGIAAILDRRPATLSGGEAQRAAIARALLSQPALLLMDEPLSGIDADARTGLIDAFAALFASLAMPVVYVTHDIAEAERLATRVLRIERGRIIG